MTPTAYTTENWHRGLQQRVEARAHLEGLTGTFDTVEARIAELEQRTRSLLADVNAF